MIKKKDSRHTRSLLIDCTYIFDDQDLSYSLSIYGSQLIKGFKRYGHYNIHVLLWKHTEALLDKLVGELESMGFAEQIEEESATYKITSAFRYAEDLVNLITIYNEDEIPE